MHPQHPPTYAANDGKFVRLQNYCIIYTCQYCGKEFKFRQSRNNHLARKSCEKMPKKSNNKSKCGGSKGRIESGSDSDSESGSIGSRVSNRSAGSQTTTASASSKPPKRIKFGSEKTDDELSVILKENIANYLAMVRHINYIIYFLIFF